MREENTAAEAKHKIINSITEGGQRDYAWKMRNRPIVRNEMQFKIKWIERTKKKKTTEAYNIHYMCLYIVNVKNNNDSKSNGHEQMN